VSGFTIVTKRNTKMSLDECYSNTLDVVQQQSPSIFSDYLRVYVRSLPSLYRTYVNGIFTRNTAVVRDGEEAERGIGTSAWLAAIGISLPMIAYFGRKIYNFATKRRPRTETPYEYRYIDELDALLEHKLDSLDKPELAEDTSVKVGNLLFSLSAWKLLSRCRRKKLIRQELGYHELPMIREPYTEIPDEEFDYENSYVEEETPVGIVVMRYCPDTESFWWYSNNKSVPYKYLETVARCYVIQYKRLNVFVDIRAELKAGYERAKQEAEKEKLEANETGESQTQKRIYAKFKKYNQKCSKLQSNRGSSKFQVVKARANRYSYKGRYDDWKPANDDTDTCNIDNITTANPQTRAMTYEEWMRSQTK